MLPTASAAAAAAVAATGPEPERFVWRAFADLTLRELYAVLRLRNLVFVVEQACAYGDVDARDPEALHLLALAGEPDGESALAGYLRAFGPAPDGPEPVARIGRVVVAPEHRSTGLGRRLMAEGVRGVERRHGHVPIELSAQSHLERFYAGFGFARVGEDYPEDGILHCDMRRVDLIGEPTALA